MLEASCYAENCFLTLTYAENPVDLVPKDLQDFMKRLRRALEPRKVRFFACGEYGSKGARPHYHVVLFGYRPSDLKYFFERNGNKIYKSAFIAERWTHGFVTVGDVTLDSAKYVAKYLQKLDKRPHNVPPFTRMSLRPGIGLPALDPESVLQTDKVYVSGKAFKTPRYFLKKMEEYGDDISILKEMRLRKKDLFSRSEKELQVLRRTKFLGNLHK